jgi:hypothetical protein
LKGELLEYGRQFAPGSVRPPNPFQPVLVPGSAVGPIAELGSVPVVGSLLVELVEDTVVLVLVEVVVVLVLLGGALGAEVEVFDEVVDDEVLVELPLLLVPLAGGHLLVRQ